MEDIKRFIEAYIEAECLAKQLSRLPDITAYNRQVDVVNAFLNDLVMPVLGMDKLDAPKSPEYYQKVSKAQPITPRYLFRIDSLDQPPANFRVFLSDVGDTKSYFDCFVVDNTKGQPAIYSVFTWGHGRPSTEHKRWYHSGGKALNFNDLRVSETLRLLPPDDDEASMQQYLS